MGAWTPLLLLAALASAEEPSALRALLGDGDAPRVEAVAGQAAQSPCPEDMVAFHDFCIDRYEAPNRYGEAPLAFKTAPEGEAWCAERGKRLCGEEEWTFACRGHENKREYPYGDKYEPSRCNDDKVWRLVDWEKLGRYPAPEALAHARALYQADPSGMRPQKGEDGKPVVDEDGAYVYEAGMCSTPEGVNDMTGNVAEWVVAKKGRPHKHAMKGCYWSKCMRDDTPDCGSINTGHPGEFRSYEAGFRCCADQKAPAGHPH